MNIEKAVITKIVSSGFGLSSLPSGKKIFVQGGLPGEIADITVDTKKNPLSGTINHLIKSHAARCTPPCRYYSQCGGCDLQHCDNSTQLTIKKEILHELLLQSSEGHVRESVDLLLNPVPSPVAFGYRQRIRLQVDDQNRLGFRKFRSHEIVPIDRCMVAEEPINKSLKVLRCRTDFHKLSSLATEIELQLNPVSENVVCLIHLVRKVRPADIAAAKSICRDVGSIESIFFLGEGFSIMGPYGREESGHGKHLSIYYDEAGPGSPPFKLRWEAGGFCQVNLRQNRHLINIVQEFCEATKEETILDLFCGMGNFSIPLGRLAKAITGIEGQGASIRSARFNAQNNGLTNTTFVKSPIYECCKKLLKQETFFDCVLIDPPRQGVPGLATDLAKLTKKRLIYISCNPVTLCRDLAALCRAGFVLKRIQPLDMFPQTHHIETVVLLEKK